MNHPSSIIPPSQAGSSEDNYNDPNQDHSNHHHHHQHEDGDDKRPNEEAVTVALELLHKHVKEKKRTDQISEENGAIVTVTSPDVSPVPLPMTMTLEQKEMEWKQRKERLKKYAEKLEEHKGGIDLDLNFQNLLLEASAKLQNKRELEDDGDENANESDEMDAEKKSPQKKAHVVESMTYDYSSNNINETPTLSANTTNDSYNVPQSNTPQHQNQNQMIDSLLDNPQIQAHMEIAMEKMLAAILNYNKEDGGNSGSIDRALHFLFHAKDDDQITTTTEKQLTDHGEIIKEEENLNNQGNDNGLDKLDSYSDMEEYIPHGMNDDFDDYNTEAFEQEKHPSTILKDHNKIISAQDSEIDVDVDIDYEEEYLNYTGSDGMVGVEAIRGDAHYDTPIDHHQISGEDLEQSEDGRSSNSSVDPLEKMKQLTPALNDNEDFSPPMRDQVSDGNKVLIKRLYSHLLPYGILAASGGKDDSYEESIRVWKDTPEEEDEGYMVHSMTKSHLIELESDFQNMVNTQLEDTEGDLLQEENVTGSREEQFEQDLKAAEDLLEKEEKRAKAVAEGVALGGKLEDVGGNTILSSARPSGMLSRIMGATKNAANENEVDDDDENLDKEDSPNSIEVDNVKDEGADGTTYDDEFGEPAGLQHIKKIGFGKEGELEQFSLPIVYNSFQTGFEPTKDLVLEPGTVVAGQYLVESELGSAAFSTAYRCVDMAADPDDYYCEVCLKVIKNTKDFFDQSLDEIKVLELLRQTGECEENNILEMRTFFYYKEHLIIVTELLRQNLFEFGKFVLDNDEVPYFTMTRLCYITRQALIALNFIHTLGLIHSDVKPENILIASYSRARVKLIDFGSSCFITDRQSSYIQSRSYRAPEVILGLPYDGKIDVWSLGCVVAEMFTGQVTFQNRSVVSMLSRIEAICGPFSRHLIMNGKHSSKFFTPNGLIYERMGKGGTGQRLHNDEDIEYEHDTNMTSNEVSDDVGEDWFKIYTPKRTTLAERLGFDTDLMERPRDSLEDEEKALFTDFVRSLLTIDPECRPTAAEALRHPWIQSGENLTEADIKYSPDES